MNARACAAGIALMVAACGATSNRTRPNEIPHRERSSAEPAFVASVEEAGSERATSDRVIARVAGQPVYADELLQLWVHRESPKVRDFLEELVLSRLVLAEAHRLEMEIEGPLLEREVKDTLADLEAELERRELDLSPDEFIRSRLGLDPTRYFERVRHEKEIDLLASRCVRTWMLASERAEVRVIVVEDEDTAQKVLKELEAGGDFADLAKRYSIEESAGEGGRLPPVVRSDVPLSRLAFSTPIGQVGGPVFAEDRYLVLLCEARPDPLVGKWSAIREAVEASLEETPIQDPEYWQWKSSMLERYEVDMTGLFELMDETLAD